jgi:hypothetical protein
VVNFRLPGEINGRTGNVGDLHAAVRERADRSGGASILQGGSALMLRKLQNFPREYQAEVIDLVSADQCDYTFGPISPELEPRPS